MIPTYSSSRKYFAKKPPILFAPTLKGAKLAHLIEKVHPLGAGVKTYSEFSLNIKPFGKKADNYIISHTFNRCKILLMVALGTK